MEYFITKDNVRIYYKVKGEGVPIIFVHGFSEDHNSFRIQQRALSKKFKTITYDLRGHGQSDRSVDNATIDQSAVDLRELIEYLDLDNIVLVGWSMGVAIIFEYIERFGLNKISKLCLVDKSPKVINDNNWDLGLYQGSYSEDDALRDLLLIQDNWLEFAEKFIKNMSPNFSEGEFNIGMEKMKRNSPKIMYSMWRSMIGKDYRSMLKYINVPTLMVFGGKSTLYSIKVGEYLQENIKGSHLVVFENCTHLLVLESPVKFNRVLQDFIE